MTCSRCQSPAPPGRTYCRSCGARLTAEAAEAAMEVDAPPAEPDAPAEAPQHTGPPCEICGAPAGGRSRCVDCEATLDAPDGGSPPAPRGDAAPAAPADDVGPAAPAPRDRRRRAAAIVLVVVALGAIAGVLLAARALGATGAATSSSSDDRAPRYGCVVRPAGCTPAVSGPATANDREGFARR